MAKKATKKEEPAKKKAVKKVETKVEKVQFDKKQIYEIEGLKSRSLVNGKTYKVTGEIAEILINSGQAKLK